MLGATGIVTFSIIVCILVSILEIISEQLNKLPKRTPVDPFLVDLFPEARLLNAGLYPTSPRYLHSRKLSCPLKHVTLCRFSCGTKALGPQGLFEGETQSLPYVGSERRGDIKTCTGQRERNGP